MIIWLCGGALLWLIGRPYWHVGASGLVYGLIAWFPSLALMRRNQTYTVLTLLVLLYYGSAIWGLLPANPEVSYEGHLSGLISGIIAAFLLRKNIPKDPKHEAEEETEYDNEDPYRRFDYRYREQITPDDSSL
jgi:membrane associated rhomboid family serine protease